MLTRYAFLDTADFEMARHIHAETHLSLYPLRSSRSHLIRSQANVAVGDSMTLYGYRYSHDMRLTALAENPDHWLAVNVRPRKRRGGGTSVGLVPGATRLASPGRPDPLEVPSTASSLGVCLKTPAVQRFLIEYFGDIPKHALVFEESFDTRRTVDRTIAQHLALAVEEDEAGSAHLSRPAVMDALFNVLMNTLLVYRQNSLSHLLDRPATAPAPRDLKRVLDYLHANPTRPISLADMITVADVPGRTLNEHFRLFTGMAPMQYLRRLRLREAHHLLVSGTAGSVTEAGLSAGFNSLGRFARLYADAYGEQPSATLKRART